MRRLFLKIWVYFQAHKNLYPPRKWKNIVSVSEIKSFGSNTDTEIEPWFRFSIRKPGFVCTLLSSQKSPSTTRLRDDVALNASNNLRLELLIQTIKH